MGATYWIEGMPHGSGAPWRDVVPESRVIKLGTGTTTTTAEAPPPEREVVAPPRRGRGRPRKAEGESSLDKFLAACERVAVDGVIVKWSLCDALKLEPSTVETYASRARHAGRWPYRWSADTPWRTDMMRRNPSPRGGGA
jgi:hypothetical protein